MKQNALMHTDLILMSIDGYILTSEEQEAYELLHTALREGCGLGLAL